jgi:hypothetical protein
MRPLGAISYVNSPVIFDEQLRRGEKIAELLATSQSSM